MYTRILVFFTLFLKNRNIITKIKRSKVTDYAALNRGSYTSAKKLRKSDKMRDLASILSLFCKEFDKLNNTGARMFDYIYGLILKILNCVISLSYYLFTGEI